MQNKNTFMKKYAFYIALAVCIIAVGAVTVIAALQSPANENHAHRAGAGCKQSGRRDIAGCAGQRLS